MFGIDVANLVRFITQVAGVVAGASSLWAFYLILKSKKKPQYVNCALCAFKLMPLFIGSFAVFMVGWFISAFKFFPIVVNAHEGIVRTNPTFITFGFTVGFQWVATALIFGLVGISIYFFKRRLFDKYASAFFLWQFILFSIILSFASYAGGKIDILQTSFMLHNWHSIITLGTVIVVDYLFLTTEKRDDLKRVLYPTYPVMSAFIWFGLGSEFVSSFLYFNAQGVGFFLNEFVITPQFLFNQVVIAVLILNGALLSVRLNDVLVNLIKPDRVEKLKGTAAKVIRVSGAVSIISWLTVTFLDFFDLTFSFWQFFVVYLVLIFAIWYMKPSVEKLLAR